jgi:hypothetical protein
MKLWGGCLGSVEGSSPKTPPLIQAWYYKQFRINALNAISQLAIYDFMARRRKSYTTFFEISSRKNSIFQKFPKG